MWMGSAAGHGIDFAHGSLTPEWRRILSPMASTPPSLRFFSCLLELKAPGRHLQAGPSEALGSVAGWFLPLNGSQIPDGCRIKFGCEHEGDTTARP
jgi:hypothetical protein